MDQEQLYTRVKTMIQSSTKKPKQMILSTVKMADIFGVTPEDIEKGLRKLVDEGKLSKEKLPTPPHHDVYLIAD